MVKIFEGPWTPPTPVEPDPPELQFVDKIRAAGLDTPKDIIADGKIHRFSTDGKKGKTGWYVLFTDGIAAGKFGCWKAGIEVAFRAETGRELSVAEQMAYTRRMTEIKVMREAELEREREAASNVCADIWNSAGLANPEHPYLKRKGIDSHGARVTGDGRLIVPLVDTDGEIKSLQYIDHDGRKLYHKSGETGGMFWVIGDPDGRIYFAEGFATAATIYQATGKAVVVCYSASNLVPVLGKWRERMGEQQEFIIVADNDRSGTGKNYADQAAAKFGARVIIPPEEGDANDYAQAGNDLQQFLEPKITHDWLVNGEDFCAQPAPLKWLVKHWLQDQALIMVHGPSGGGKTFCVLDMALRMVSNIPEWRGHKVTGGEVVYLAGEGHHGLRGRIAAFKQEYGGNMKRLWLSKEGCDLNTNEGYMRVVENVKGLPSVPKLIIVDTLHRFLRGDENSAQDAKTMLDACGSLMLEFGCSVLLVHHTGVSEEAQHRARGSSAWRGALDIEISVTPNKNGGMTISQKKAKDSEQAQDIYVELQSVPIAGWVDEDGEPVTSAVVVDGVEPTDEKKESDATKFQTMFRRAWFDSQCEDIDGRAYVSKSALMELMRKDRMKESSIKNYVKPSFKNGPIFALINSGIIAAEHNGWVVINPTVNSAFMIEKNG